MPVLLGQIRANSGWWDGGRGTATPLKSTSQRASEFLVAHPGSLSPKALHQPQLFGGEVVTVAGERTLEVLPRSREKHGIRRGLACQITQCGFAQSAPSDTAVMAALVYRALRFGRRSGP